MMQLLILILLPLFIAFLLVLAFLPTKGRLLDRARFILVLHPELGLMKQGLLWLSIIAPVSYFFATGSLAWKGYEISLTANGFQTFLSLSVLPLGLLSLAVPLSVLVGRLHSTEQAAKQIEIVSMKNNLDIYRSHRQDLFSYFEQIGETEYLSCVTAKFKVHPRLHKNFFAGSPERGLPLPNREAFEDIESELVSARFSIDATLRNDKNQSKALDFYLNGCSTICRLSAKLGIPELYIGLTDKGVLVPVRLSKQPEIKSLVTIGTTTDELVAAFRVAKSFYLNLCDFAGVTPDVKPNEKRKYIDEGGKYKEVGDYPVIERLHETVIKSCIENNKNAA